MEKLNLSMLNEKEQIILGLWICGQTAKESAIYLKKSNRTIESYRDRIKCKLGIYTASELRKKALASMEFNDLLQKGMNLILGNQSLKQYEVV